MFMPENCDVLIVGGGPAGLAAGETAMKQGVRTLILERQQEIGYPIHTSGGSWVSDMQALNIPRALYHPINKVVFVSPQREVPLNYQPAVACVVDVRNLYQHLAARARSEEHTSELQSRQYLVCRLLLEKKKKRKDIHVDT